MSVHISWVFGVMVFIRFFSVLVCIGRKSKIFDVGFVLSVHIRGIFGVLFCIGENNVFRVASYQSILFVGSYIWCVRLDIWYVGLYWIWYVSPYQRGVWIVGLYQVLLCDGLY